MSRFLNGFNNILRKGGTQVQIVYFNTIYNDIYDDDVNLFSSGSLNLSGLVFPVKGSDYIAEQGDIKTTDLKLYICGSISTDLCKIRVGSPYEYYSVVPDGKVVYEEEGNKIYQKIYIRKLTGSVLGE